MAITYTNKLRLRQIEYLHNGLESADAHTETITILDAIFTYLISYRVMDSDENAGTDTPLNGSILIGRLNGRPMLNRLALPF